MNNPFVCLGVTNGNVSKKERLVFVTLYSIILGFTCYIPLCSSRADVD